MRKWNKSLMRMAIAHFFLAVLFLLFSVVDARELLGISLWYKPMKFALSIGIYVISLAYLVEFVSSVAVKRWIVWGTTIGLGVEMVLITMQAIRGVKSHFNEDDIFGIVVYVIMGIFIVFVSILLIILGIYLYRKPPLAWSRPFSLAVTMAIALTTVGTIVGGYMSRGSGHTVGGVDGEVGLPVLSWSVLYGDWRVAHFLGLHALQFFIIAGWLLQKKKGAIRSLWVLFIGYVIALTVVIVMTFQGKPIF